MQRLRFVPPWLASSYTRGENDKKLLEKLQSSASKRPRYMPKAAVYSIIWMCAKVTKMRQGRPKSQDCGGSVPDVCHPAKYECSRSSRRRAGTGKPFWPFLRRSRSHMPFTPNCMTVYNTVVVAEIVCEIWTFKGFSLNVCHSYVL